MDEGRGKMGEWRWETEEGIVQFPGAVAQLDTSLADVEVADLYTQLWLAA